MESADTRRIHNHGLGYQLKDNQMVLSSSLVNETAYTLPPMKTNCELLRNSNSPEEYHEKEEFMREITDSIEDTSSRYRLSRQSSINFQKVPLNDDSVSNSYSLKSLANDIQDLSFSVDLRTLNRDVQDNSSYGYYNRNVTPSTDMYTADFSQEFSSHNFSNSLPSTSGMFSSDDTSTNYVLSENQADELLLNGIELNENEKLILSNEEIALLTQGKPGSCLELILNNGEVLYAVIDSENDYNSSSSRLTQMSKEIIPLRQCPLDENLVNVNDLSSEPQYHDAPMNTSNFSKTPPISEFDTKTDTNYRSVISTPLSKSIDTSQMNTESFNLCCNFSTDDSASHFTSVMDNYMVSEKLSYEQPLMRKSDLNYPCTSTSTSKDIPSKTDSKNVSNSEVRPIPSKLDYFPNAVNSIVVSETGKKYPKKYSFYSNNFSSFLNQDQSFVKDARKENVDKQNNAIHMNNSVKNPDDGIKNVIDDESVLKTNGSTEQELLKRGFQPVASCDVQKTSPSVETVSVLRQNATTSSSANNRTSVISATSNLAQVDKSLTTKFLNSRLESAVNSICDRAVQSRARATLPSSYLSINRIKSEKSSKPVYGVFAKKTIPSRTQFGPIEGVLVKQEEAEEEEIRPDKSESSLQLSVELEKGKFMKLDISNEDASNWMRFVRPAGYYGEQNLILSQHDSSLYFTTIEVIHPKQELLVWYSVWYAQIRNFSLLPGDPCADAVYKDIDAIEPSGDKSTSATQNAHRVEIVGSPADLVVCTDEEDEDDNDGNDLVIDSRVLVYNHVDGNEKYDKGNVDNQSLSSNGSPDAENGAKMCKVKSTACGFKKHEKLNKSLWLCSYCDLTFSNCSLMNLHILIHASDNVEDETMDSATEPTNQTECADRNGCPQCYQTFSQRQQLITHVSKHGQKIQRWSDKNLQRKCDAEESQNDNSVSGDKNEDKTYECNPCRKKFKNPAALSVHKRFHSDDSVLECPICEVTFHKLNAMREHVHNHAVNGVYTCPHCPKKYDRYKYIRKHIRACHCKVTFNCKLCKKSFKSRYKLKSHMLRHSDEREFLCANCGKQFKRKDKLSEHMKNMHSEERERKSLEIMETVTTKKGKSLSKKSSKKKLPTKVLRLITENVNDYFYKCYICNIGFKRRGMLVNHLNSFHPGVSLDTVPELNVPILKAYCNFYCLYCDKVYKSNSKRKAHIIKSHPGAKIPGNLERGTVLNDPYAKHVGSVISNPFNCEFCYRQYASRAKLLNHHRKNHADLLPPDMKSPRSWNSQKRKRKTDSKVDNVASSNVNDSPSTDPPLNDIQIQSVEYEIEHSEGLADGVNSQDVITLPAPHKENGANVNQQIVSLTHLLNDELRNSTTQEQYLKILQSTNGVTIAQTDENGEHPVSLENPSALLQQILASYSFPSS